jgi:hypothetical protein
MFTRTSQPPNEEEGSGHGFGARKVPFVASTSALGAGQCATAASTATNGTPRLGFAILRVNGNGRLIVTVSLKHAAPNATYLVTVAQSTGSCSSPFTVRTNRRGNGNGHMRLMLSPGATSAWVTAVSGSNVLVTRLATFTPKAESREDGEHDAG